MKGRSFVAGFDLLHLPHLPKGDIVRIMYVPRSLVSSLDERMCFHWRVMIFKKLTRQGNSTALIIDRQLMDLMGIERDAVVKISVQGRKLLIEPLSQRERAAKISEIQQKTMKKNAELFRRLAK